MSLGLELKSSGALQLIVKVLGYKKQYAFEKYSFATDTYSFGKGIGWSSVDRLGLQSSNCALQKNGK